MDRTIRFPNTVPAASVQAPSDDTPEELFLAQLPYIDRCIMNLCARSGLHGADAEDCASWVRSRLIEDDYAALRKFSGRSSLRTYLTVVVTNLVRDYRIRLRGRWRASAAARRLGGLAERLERLVYRQRLAFREAVTVLRSEGVSGVTDRELAQLFDQIPVRLPLRPDSVGEDTLADVPTERNADGAVAAEEERRERDSVSAALARSLATLPPEDRLILRMRFWDDMSVADIARGLSLQQKPLYRRIERGLGQLRERLRAEGVQPEQALAFIGAPDAARDFDESDPSIVEE